MYQTQFYPNRIVTTWKNDYKHQPLELEHFRYSQRKKSNKNLKVSKTSANLSASSKRAIRDSIMSMYSLSKPRTIKISNKKFIYNYRQSFVTLTLPSKQVHTDVEIKQCLNNFFTSLRATLGINNYVWKAELQKNENIHFHIILDKYCTYQALRHYWNKAINVLGYVDRYSLKMSSLTIKEYAKLRNKPINEVLDAYGKGRLSRWSAPNSVDVRSVFTENNVSSYLSKYFAKSDESNIDLDRLRKFGRVWARSRSLSRLKYKNKFDYEEIKEFIEAVISNTKAAYLKHYDYATIIYLNVSKMMDKNRVFFEHIIKANSIRYGYKAPV